MAPIKVNSTNVTYSEDAIESRYAYETSEVEWDNGRMVVTPKETKYNIRTQTKVPKLGVLLVGWGGNNGSTLTACCLANRMKMTWKNKEGIRHSNYYGSITQASTVLLGNSAVDGSDVFVPFKDVLPMVDPSEIIFDGWDISAMNIADSMERAKVLDYDLQRQLRPYLVDLKPRPSVYYPDFIAANQSERADNVLEGTKQDHVEHIRQDIRDFKATHDLDKVIVLWTANTERFSAVEDSLNGTAENLLRSIRNNESEVSASTIFAVASILEGVTYINGSPQNTFVPGVIELAERERVFIGGDDFKSGQTKLKSVLVDFLVSAGIKPTSIVSYNHLGNNDGKNLSAPQTFRSKEISKSNVVDDMVNSNRILYDHQEKPDHCVVIKYIPYVGDSKRAMDEYTSEIMMGGRNTLVIHNTCEDSLLASPLIVDLVVLAELCERIEFRVGDDPEFQRFNAVLSLLSYMCKAPLVPKGAPVVNALFRQKMAIENVLRACIGLRPTNYMNMEHRLENIPQWSTAPTTTTPEISALKHKIAVNSSTNGHFTNGTAYTNGITANGHSSDSEIEK